MGCGILFPRDYNSEVDSEGSHDLSPDFIDDGYDYLGDEEYDHNSDSEDEEWWEKPYAENGTKVEVRPWGVFSVTLDISRSPIDFQWGSWKYPG